MRDNTSHNDGPVLENQEIEITPEMIEAGRKALWESGLLPEGQVGTAAELIVVKEVFCAMMRSHG